MALFSRKPTSQEIKEIDSYLSKIATCSEKMELADTANYEEKQKLLRELGHGSDKSEI